MKTMKWLMIVMVGLFSACHTGEDLREEPTIPQELTEIISLEGIPSNKANTYDEVGRLHNEFLAHVFGNPANDIERLSNDDIIKEIKEYAMDTYGEDIEVALLEEQLSLAEDGLANGYEKQIIDSPFSEGAKGYFRELTHIIKMKFEARVSYEELKAAIVILEQDILRDNSLTRHDLEMLLTATAIARYSAYFWTNGGEGITVKENPSSKITFKSVIRAIATVTADTSTAIENLALGRGPVRSAAAAASTSTFAYNWVTYGMPGS